MLKTYGTTEQIYIKSVKDVEKSFHARVFEADGGQCGEHMRKAWVGKWCVQVAALGVGYCCRRGGMAVEI